MFFSWPPRAKREAPRIVGTLSPPLYLPDIPPAPSLSLADAPRAGPARLNTHRTGEFAVRGMARDANCDIEGSAQTRGACADGAQQRRRAGAQSGAVAQACNRVATQPTTTLAPAAHVDCHASLRDVLPAPALQEHEQQAAATRTIATAPRNALFAGVAVQRGRRRIKSYARINPDGCAKRAAARRVRRRIPTGVVGGSPTAS
ncbi:hypothetical protein K523DRAFT_378523, partial [Schizophyllum commune Tattone D]